MFVIPSNVIRIQQELKDYQRLCQEFNHSPAKEEFDEIVKFILLQSGGDTGMFESVEVDNLTSDYLYENFIQKLELTEKGSSNSRDSYAGEEGIEDLVVGAVNTAKKVGVGLAIGAGTAAVYIAYRFKKKKLDASLKKEHDIEMQKIENFREICELAIKKAKIKGEAPPKLTDITQPAVEDVALPDKPDRAADNLKKTLSDIFTTSNPK